jgi:two-component system LytT family sensor kinase
MFATSRAGTVEEAADQTCAVVASALGVDAPGVRWHPAADDSGVGHSRVILHRERRDEAAVLVPTAERPSLVVEIAPLPASRRLLSDEVAFLESIATILGRRVDVLRVARERFERDLREREILQLATESELRALRAQLNPHFLFNALTTLGYLMQTAPDRALGTLYRLTELLRAVLRGPAGETVPLGEELDIIDAYLAIERERFQERLSVTVDIPDALREARVPPLLLQPLVENAVKHGITPLRRGGSIHIAARLVRHGPRAGEVALQLVVADTGAGVGGDGRASTAGHGVGLSNLARRLERLYGERGAFAIASAPDRGTTVTLHLPVDATVAEELGGVHDDVPLRSAG